MRFYIVKRYEWATEFLDISKGLKFISFSKTFYLQRPRWIWWHLLKFHMYKLQSEMHQLIESQSSSCFHLIGCWGHQSPGAPCRLWTRILLRRGGRLHSRAQWRHQCPPSYCCLSLTEDWILPQQLQRNKHKKINSKEMHSSHAKFDRNNRFYTYV